MKYYYLLNGKIISANDKMPEMSNFPPNEFGKNDYHDAKRNWHNSLQPCEISESELENIRSYLCHNTKFEDFNPHEQIEVTNIVRLEEIKTITKSGTITDYQLFFKHPKQVEQIEAVELKYTTKEMIDAVNYGFSYAHESQNHTGDVPLGNILQWIMYKRNLLDVPKEFKDLKNNYK